MAALSKNTHDVADLLRVEVCLPNQVVLHVAEEETVLLLVVYVVAEALRVVELSFLERAFLVADLARPDLLNELVRLPV